MDVKEKIEKINSDIDKIRDIVLKFACNFAKNTNGLNHKEKISTNSLKYFSNISNSVEFKKMEDILINKFSQIENSINTQIMIWSQIFYIKKDILQVIPVIFRFMMINSIYTMIDVIICLYKWSKLLNKIYIEKLCIVEYKKMIINELNFKNNFNYFINLYNSFKDNLMKILYLRDNIIHSYNTYDNKTLASSQKDIFGIETTLYTIDLIEIINDNINNLFFIKLKTLKRIDKSDEIYNPKNENDSTIIDLFEIWVSFMNIFEFLFNKINYLLFNI